ncbi:transposase [Streptomyces sp. NPDC090499]|uniref:transposase n=1 Tax=Streptomyces sp. NPDC090499 TaxID=3365965 RepID=UPI0038270701
MHRVRNGVPWRDLPERFGVCRTVWERHRLWSADGNWERPADPGRRLCRRRHRLGAAVDSTIVRRRRPAQRKTRTGRRGRACVHACLIRLLTRPEAQPAAVVDRDPQHSLEQDEFV